MRPSTNVRAALPRLGRVLPQCLVTILLLAVASCTVSGLPSAGAEERVERRISIGGQTRSYVAHLPDDYASRRDLRVLIAYHPALGDGAFMENTAALHDAPGGQNFIVVYPDGVRRTWNAGECCGIAERMNVNDVGFFDAMMADLSNIASIRPKAYVTGYSNGALMAYYLVCQRPGRIAAAAPFAAYPPPSAMQNCPPGRVPLLHIHGDSDEGAPVEGGMTRYLGQLPPASETVAALARRNGCNVSQTTRRSIPELDTTCVVYTGCDGGAETLQCTVPGLGHAWPGMSGRPGGRFGPARPELAGSEAVIDFFLRH